MNQEVQSNQINNILSKCWADASFKQKLLANPAEVLKAEGVEIPAGYTIQVLENTDKVVNYVLPPNPNAELSDSELEAVAGGKNISPVGGLLGQGGHGIHNMHLTFDEARAKIIK